MEPRVSDIDELDSCPRFFFGNKSEVKYGLEVKSIRTDFEFVNGLGLRLAQEQKHHRAWIFLGNIGRLLAVSS